MKVRGVVMRPGDLLFLYTDGVTEAEDGNEGQFGENRLVDLLAQGDPADAAQWVARVNAAVHTFAQGQPQSDDITFLALGR